MSVRIIFFILLIVFGMSGALYARFCYFNRKDEMNIIIENNKKNEKTEKTEKAKHIRNVLIVGRTGSGKSTLANVLLGEEKFSEVAGLNSGTKEIQSEVFKWKGNHYRVIDTIGTGDTAGLSNEKMVSSICEIIDKLRGDGIKQVFYVIRDRFTKEEVEALELFKTLFLNNKVTSNITIICSNFPKFEDKKECNEDTRRLLVENKSIAEVIEKCEIIHVDNPPLFYVGSKKIRESSRKKLLGRLEFTCEHALAINPIESIDAEKLFEEVVKNNQT